MTVNKITNRRYDGVKVNPRYRSESEADKYKIQAKDDAVAIVPSGLAVAGDKIHINGVSYVVVDTDVSLDSIQLLFNNKEEPLRYSSIIGKDKPQNILAIPKDSTDTNLNLDSYTPTKNPVATGTSTSNTTYGTSPDGSLVMGAGENGDNLNESGIVKFAQFVTSLEFLKRLTEMFTQDGTKSLYDYLASIMGAYYHHLFFIPNLKGINAIIAKPETLFVYPPSCNLIFPNIKGSIAYTRAYKAEPTRLMLISDPVSALGAEDGRPLTLNAVLYMEEEDTQTYKNGLRLYKSNPVALDANKNLFNDTERPMLNITNYERKNGIKSEIVNLGTDIYMYLSSQVGGNNADHSYSELVDPKNLEMATLSQNKTQIGKIMAGLAAYELCRQRFMSRQGSVQMYFNPYIVPGFPLASMETYKDGMTIFGYATHVAHDLTDRSWTTTVSFTAGHTDDENCPRVFPVVEEEYTTGIDTTYKNMLGDTVTSVTNTDIPDLITKYAQENHSMINSYQKIWRETTSLDEYLEKVADGAKIMDDQNYTWFQNSETSAFFDVAIQDRIREYSNDIMNRHIAYHHDSVR